MEHPAGSFPYWRKAGGDDMPEMNLALDSPIPTMQPGRDIRRAAQFGKYFVYSHAFVPFTSVATGTQARQTLTAEGQTSAFQVMRLSLMADNLGDKLLLVLTPNGEQFMFESLYLSQLGSGQFPFNVPIGLTIKRNNILSALLTDTKLIAGNNNVRIAYHGAKMYPGPLVGARRYAHAKPWWYPANFTAQDSGTGPLTANQTRSYTVRTDGDSDFEIQKISIVADAPILLQVQTDADDWFDTPLRGELFGWSQVEAIVPPIDPSGWHPFVLPMPRLITPGGYIRTVVSNTVAANNRCEIQYHGVRLYPGGGMNP